jgi:hypothetical protein
MCYRDILFLVFILRGLLQFKEGFALRGIDGAGGKEGGSGTSGNNNFLIVAIFKI